MIKEGSAVDLGAIYLHNESKKREQPSPRNFEVLGVSYGTVGRNGALLKDKKTGRLYGIASRCSALYYYV